MTDPQPSAPYDGATALASGYPAPPTRPGAYGAAPALAPWPPAVPGATPTPAPAAAPAAPALSPAAAAAAPAAPATAPVTPPPAAPPPDGGRGAARTPGTRTRSGNGMSRSRACILSGAAKCIARYGTRKTTMGDISREGGIAKGTLYNHFRTKADVYEALLADEVDDLLTQVAALPAPAGSVASVVDALAFAAEWLSDHPVLRALREREPELAARLARPADSPAWDAVRQAALHRVSLAVAAGALHPQTDPTVAVDTLLRWAVSHVGWPATSGTAEAAARLLVHGLLAAPYETPT